MYWNNATNRAQKRAQERALRNRNNSLEVTINGIPITAMLPDESTIEQKVERKKFDIRLSEDDLAGILKSFEMLVDDNDMGQGINYDIPRCSYQMSQKTVMKKVCRLIYEQEGRDEIFVCRKLKGNVIQVDNFVREVTNEGRVPISTEYRFSVIFFVDTFPFVRCPCRIEKFGKNMFVRFFNESAEREQAEQIASIACRIFTYSSWAISYWGMEPDSTDTIRVNMILPEEFKHW